MEANSMTRRISLGLALALVFLCVWPLGQGRADAQSARKIALLIGNGHYQTIGALTNPVPDAQLMASTLQSAGFEVTLLTDADQTTMKTAFASFGRSLRAAGPDTTALFYYAGHAVQSFGNNYLLPVDTAIRDQADLDLVGVEASWVLRQLYTAKVRTNIVILDSCRNNPFKGIAGFTDQGLAEMNAPTGSFIAYSTAPGSVARDGTGANSPYTEALAQAISAGPQSIEQLFKKVRIQVLGETGGAQTPWESSSLTTDFSFYPEAQERQTSIADEEELWQRAKDSNDSLRINLYLYAFPKGSHRDEAEALLAALSQPAPTAPQTGQGATQVTFSAPLTEGEPQIVGKSIEELITSSPLFPPFEGIPDELWKGQKCKNCHQWTRDRICEQATTYLADNAERSLKKEHPLGTSFKQNLRNWAAAGCP
jgi:uncharacterized caspase-like protein